MDAIADLYAQAMEGIEKAVEPLQPYAEQATFATLPSVQAELEALNLPAPPDVVKYLVVMLFCFPLCAVYTFLPGPTLRHVFNLAWGVVLAQFVFGVQWVHAAAASLMVYLILVLTAKVSVLDGVRPVLIFGAMLSYMTVAHLYRQYTDYMGWRLDITGPLMIMTIKLSSVGYQYNDGVTQAALVKRMVDTKTGGLQRMFKERQDNAIDHLPNPLEFFAYVFLPTSFFSGPAFDFKQYLVATNRSAAEAAKLPSRAGRVLQTAFFGLLFLGLTSYGQANWNFLSGQAPNTKVAPFILEQPTVWHTYGNALVALFFVRSKYYFAWLLSESTAVLAGFGYDARRGNWMGAANVDVLGFEFATNLSNGSKAWNKHTQVWLERYVYKRCTRAMGLNMLLTYFVSAFWHGFYPGYYLFFMSVPLMQNLSKKFTADVRPHTLTDGKPKSWKIVYDVVGIVITHCTLNYLASAFVALGWDNALTIWSSYKWSLHIVFASLYIPVGMLFPAKKRASTKPKTA